jgi:hypothetical protein
MARINTSKMLNNEGYYSAIDSENNFGSSEMTISPLITD